MKKIVILMIMVLPFQALSQQDPLYKLYQFNQVMINPAYAGVYNRFSASFISSVQWLGIEGAPVTNTATIQSALKKGEMGVGAIFINDQIGVNNNNEVQVAASYNINMGESKLAMGVQGGLINYTYDLSRLELDYVDDERLYSGLNNSMEPNFGAGLMFMNVNYYAGLSVPRILDVDVNDGVVNSNRYKKHIYLSGGYYFRTFSDAEIKVSGLAILVEESRPSLDLNVSTNLDGLVWAGFSMRDLRHFGVFTFFELGKNIKFGYAFELPSTSLIQDNYGTHQISIAFDASLVNEHHLRNRHF